MNLRLRETLRRLISRQTKDARQEELKQHEADKRELERRIAWIERQAMLIERRQR